MKREERQRQRNGDILYRGKGIVIACQNQWIVKQNFTPGTGDRRETDAKKRLAEGEKSVRSCYEKRERLGER